MTLDIQSKNYDLRALARLSVSFVLSTAAGACLEILLGRTDILLAAAVPFVFYMLASLRYVPWRTPMRKAFSSGFLLGMVMPMILGYVF